MNKATDKKADKRKRSGADSRDDLQKKTGGHQARDNKRDDVLPETGYLEQNQGKLDTPSLDGKPEGQTTRN